VLNDGGLAQMLRSVGGQFEQQRTMFQPLGGMEQIPKAIAFVRCLKGPIHYSTEVREASVQTPNTVDRRLRRPCRPARDVITADYCVCTLPLSVLKGIDELQVSPSFKQAIAGVRLCPGRQDRPPDEAPLLGRGPPDLWRPRLSATIPTSATSTLPVDQLARTEGRAC
jgi:monoamine oxidase